MIVPETTTRGILPNTILNSSYKLTEQEINLFVFIYSKIKNLKNIDSDIIIHKNDLLSIYNNKGNSKHQYLRDDLISLRSKTFEYYDTIHKCYVITGIIDGAVFYTTQSRLQIFVSYFVKDLIVKTTANYTEFNLQTLLKLKGIYAKRIYMQLCRFNQTGTYQISMMDFLNQMGLGGKYQRIYDLKKRVLNPAIDLINEHSEYNVMVNAQGDYFIFGFRLKQAADNNFIPELYDRLIALGLADWQAKQAMSTMTAIQIKYVLQRYYQALANAHTIHNPGAYIWQALCADGCPKNKVNIQLSITDE